MSDNPFAPPTVEVQLPAAELTVPNAIRRNIAMACVGSFVWGAIALFNAVMAVRGHRVSGSLAWQFLDAVVILGLAFGINVYSRVCAVLAAVYFIYAVMFTYFMRGSFSAINLGLMLLCLYMYVQGAIGTFAYHKHLKQAAA